jgi:hypothetical protein
VVSCGCDSCSRAIDLRDTAWFCGGHLGRWSLDCVLRLRKTGWFPHRVVPDLFRLEEGSCPWEGSFDPAVLRDIEGLFLANAGRPIGPIREASLGPYGTTRAVRLAFATPGLEAPLFGKDALCYTTSTPLTAVALWKAVLNEVANGWLVPCDLSEIVCSGRLFLGPKERLIYDPAVLNSFLADVPIKYPRPSDLLASDASCGVKGDIKAAFKHVGIAPEYQRYLGVILDGVCFRWSVLPFGLRQSPALFSMALDASIGGMDVTAYVDDIAIVDSSGRGVMNKAAALVRRLHEDGWTLAPDKWFLRPADRLVFIGFRIDFRNATIRILRSKADKALALIAESLLGADRFHKALLQKALGIVAWLSSVWTLLRVPRYRLDRWVHEDAISWPSDVAEDADYLMRLLILAPRLRNIATVPRSPIFLVTDAGASGWGAIARVGNQMIRMAGRLPESVQQSSSTAREFAAVEASLQALERRGVIFDAVEVCSDSQSMVAAMHKARFKSIEDASFRSLMLRVEQGLTISPTWQPRYFPTALQADALSGVADTNEWTLTREAASLIGGGPPPTVSWRCQAMSVAPCLMRSSRLDPSRALWARRSRCHWMDARCWCILRSLWFPTSRGASGTPWIAGQS